MKARSLVKQAGRLSHIHKSSIRPSEKIYSQFIEKYALDKDKLLSFRQDIDKSVEPQDFNQIIGVQTIRRYKLKEQQEKRKRRETKVVRHNYNKHELNIQVQRCYNNFLRSIQKKSQQINNPHKLALKESTLQLRQLRINQRNSFTPLSQYSHDFDRKFIISMETSNPVTPYIKPARLGELLREGVSEEREKYKSSNLMQNISRQFDKLRGVSVQNSKLQDESNKKKSKTKSTLEKAEEVLQASTRISKNLMNTIQAFDLVKQQKNEEMQMILSTYRRDLPITRSIRNRNYNIEASSNNTVKDFRRSAEAQRKSNYQGTQVDLQNYNKVLQTITRTAIPGQQLQYCERYCDKVRTRIQDSLKVNRQVLEEIQFELSGEFEDRLAPLVRQQFRKRYVL